MAPVGTVGMPALERFLQRLNQPSCEPYMLRQFKHPLLEPNIRGSVLQLPEMKHTSMPELSFMSQM